MFINNDNWVLKNDRVYFQPETSLKYFNYGNSFNDGKVFYDLVL